MEINFGCGAIPVKGQFGMDIVKGQNVHVVADLNAKALPFLDQSIDKITAHHVLEHIQLLPLMKQIYRVLKVNGEIHIKVPHASSFVFWDDPTHIRPFTSRTFDYWHEPLASYYGFQERFTIKSRRLNFLPHSELNSFNILPFITNPIRRLLDKLANKNIRFCERFWAPWVGGFAELEITLIKTEK